MKEKISLVLSWWAFLHAVVIAIALADWQMGSQALGNFIADIYLDPFSSFSEEPFVLNLPLVIWAALYVFTGSPRFLPWRKPLQTAKEG